MIAPPKKLADQTVKAYLKYRDSDLHHLSSAKQAIFFERAQELFKRLVKVMRCTPPEESMVSENIAHMILHTPPSEKPPR